MHHPTEPSLTTAPGMTPSNSPLSGSTRSGNTAGAPPPSAITTGDAVR